MTTSDKILFRRRHANTAKARIAIAALTRIVVTYAEAQGSAIRSSRDLDRRLLHLVSEMGELIEAYRLENGAPSPQAPGMSHVEEELADIFALLLLIADHLDVDLVLAMRRKLAFSIRQRPRLHGKEW